METEIERDREIIVLIGYEWWNEIWKYVLRVDIINLVIDLILNNLKLWDRIEKFRESHLYKIYSLELFEKLQMFSYRRIITCCTWVRLI